MKKNEKNVAAVTFTVYQDYTRGKLKGHSNPRAFADVTIRPVDFSMKTALSNIKDIADGQTYIIKNVKAA